MHFSKLRKTLMVLGALSCILPLLGAPFIPSKRHALWVYPDLSQPASNPITNPVAQQQLIASARASGVNLIFLSVYNSTPNAAGRYLYDEGQLAALITAAHSASIDVYAAYGDPGWPAIGCGATDNPSFPVRRMFEIGDYNRAAAYNGKFNGVILDVEPPSPDQNLLNLYSCMTQIVRNNGINMSVAINAFWTLPIGTGKPAYQQIADLGFTNIVIMGYRTKAGTFGANDNGIVSVDQALADYVNNPFTVLVGLETKNLGSADPNNTQSFYALGQAALDYQAQLVYNQFAAHNVSFAGIAVHNYNDSYLGGTPSWPLTDPTFPNGNSVMGVIAGSPTIIPVGLSAVSVNFSAISNPGATVTVLPGAPGTGLPPLGYNLAGLSFDVSTTAAFTGPATVCFKVPSLDAVTFASLRVLHYVNGSPQDQTVLTGPNAPDPITQTICASVTSFSPFVLAKYTGLPLKSFSVSSLVIHPESFQLTGEFELPAGALLTLESQARIQLGTTTLPITPAALSFEGALSGKVRIRVRIESIRAEGVRFVLDVQGINLTNAPEPMPVKLQVGPYVGGTIVFGEVHR